MPDRAGVYTDVNSGPLTHIIFADNTVAEAVERVKDGSAAVYAIS